jgi:hypothetical protein
LGKQLRINRRIVILVSVLVLLLISIAIFYYIFPNGGKKHHPLIAIYPTAVPGHHPFYDTGQFLLDLDLVKSLGFEGVRLHQADYEEYGYGRVADDLNDRDLEFVMVLHSWNNSRFPENETYVDVLIAYFQNIAEQLQNKSNLLWYALDYPYDWNRPYTQLGNPAYHSQLQRTIDAVHETDPYHQIYLISGMIDVVATPPMDFDHVDGFGIMPYSREDLIDEIDIERIHWIDKYRATDKELYIAEWGVQTLQNSPNRTYNYGLASNESTKVKMIQEFVDYIREMVDYNNCDIYWDYFGLHDFPMENSDWGIAYFNNTLKLSGEAMKEALAKSL